MRARVEQRGGDQAVLGAPGGPVAHGLLPAAHPPEMGGGPGAQHPAVHLPRQAGVQPGEGGVQLPAQQKMNHSQQRAGLGGEQVHHRAGRVGQGKLGRVPEIAVVGGELPGALLTDGPEVVGDPGQKFAGIPHALRHDQPAQGAAAGKVGVLISGAVAGAGKIRPQAQRQGGNAPPCAGGLPAAGKPAVKAGQVVPGGAVAHPGAGNPAPRREIPVGGKQFSQHRQNPPGRRGRRAAFADRRGG